MDKPIYGFTVEQTMPDGRKRIKTFNGKRFVNVFTNEYYEIIENLQKGLEP